MKYCSKCDTIKPLHEFNKRSEGPWYRSHCKKCCSKQLCEKAKLGRNRRKPKPSPEVKREQLRLASARYNAKSSSKPKHAAHEAMRRCAKLQRTPKWLTEYQREGIALYYEVAAALTISFGQQMDVDHIVPLRGVLVSGLHVPWNLQIMARPANNKKS